MVGNDSVPDPDVTMAEQPEPAAADSSTGQGTLVDTRLGPEDDSGLTDQPPEDEPDQWEASPDPATAAPSAEPAEGLPEDSVATEE